MRNPVARPAWAVAAALLMALSAAAPAAPGDDKKPGQTLRPGAIQRPQIKAKRPVAQHRTLEVKEFSGDFTRWVDRMTVTERRALTFRWKNIRGPVTNPRWQVTNSPNAPLKSGIVRQGTIPGVPAKGARAVFNIETTNILPLNPPAAPRKYYVRVVVSEAGRPDYVDSRPVVITYQQPSQEVTQFTEEGLSTTPPKKVAPPGDRRYSYPKIMGVHMDWCKRWASECGEPAADEFCRREGYKRARDFSKTSHTTAGVCEGGKCKTRIISTYQICHHPSCRAFFHITCTHEQDCVTKSTVLTTKMERCDKEKLKIVSKNGVVDIPLQGKYLKTFHSIPVTPKFNWYCGSSSKSTGCPSGTTEIDVKRYGVITNYMAEDRVEIKCRKVYQVCTD